KITKHTNNQALTPDVHARSHRKNKKKLHTPHKPMTKAKTFMRWMLASTIQFSHNTPHHPEQTTTTQQQLALTWCGHQDQPKQMDCCPRHPTVHQRIYLEKLLSLYMLQKIPVTNPYMVGGVFPLRFKPVA